MVLDGFRKVGDIFLNPLVKLFIKVDPNFITVASFLLAVLAGFSFMVSKAATHSILNDVPLMIVLGSFFVIASGIFDLLDGKVARLTGKVSLKGDFLDHMFDRYSDIIILIGLVFSGYVIMPLGVLALASILMASYMGTQGQALGLGRDYKGILGRADRIVLLIFFPLFHLLVLIFLKDGNFLRLFTLPDWEFFDLIDNSFTILDFLMLVFIFGGNWTAITRALTIWKGLGEKDKETKAQKQKEAKDKKKDKMQNAKTTQKEDEI